MDEIAWKKEQFVFQQDSIKILLQWGKSRVHRKKEHPSGLVQGTWAKRDIHDKEDQGENGDFFDHCSGLSFTLFFPEASPFRS
jgi:hypothetical protein